MVNIVFHTELRTWRVTYKYHCWFVGLYFKHTAFQTRPAQQHQYLLSPSVLLFSKKIWVHPSKVILSTLCLAAVGPNVHNLTMQLSPPAVSRHHMPLISLLQTAAAHQNSTQSLAIT